MNRFADTLGTIFRSAMLTLVLLGVAFLILRSAGKIGTRVGVPVVKTAADAVANFATPQG